MHLLKSKYTLHTIVSSNQFNLPIAINIGSNSLTDDLQPWRCFHWGAFPSSSDQHVTGYHWWSLEGAVTHDIIPDDRLCRSVHKSEEISGRFSNLLEFTNSRIRNNSSHLVSPGFFGVVGFTLIPVHVYMHLIWLDCTKKPINFVQKYCRLWLDTLPLFVC